MGKIYAIANQKGGVGKTTTVINWGASLAAAEKKVLLVDFDPQGNCTSGLGISKKEVKIGIYDSLLKGIPPEDVIIPSLLPSLYLMPTTIELAGAEVELAGLHGRESLLKSVITPISKNYDYVLIDCPPSLGLLTINALVACHKLFAPIQTEYFAMEGISELMRTVKMVRESLNPSLEIEGVLLTMFDERTNLSKQVADDLRSYFGTKVYKSIIPRNIRLAEAPSFGKPILLYDINSKGAQSYLAFTKEFLINEQKGIGTRT